MLRIVSGFKWRGCRDVPILLLLAKPELTVRFWCQNQVLNRIVHNSLNSIHLTCFICRSKRLRILSFIRRCVNLLHCVSWLRSYLLCKTSCTPKFVWCKHLSGLFLSKQLLKDQDQCVFIGTYLLNQHSCSSMFARHMLHNIRILLSLNNAPNDVFLILVNTIQKQVLKLTFIAKIASLLIPFLLCFQSEPLKLFELLWSFFALIIVVCFKEINYSFFNLAGISIK